MGAVIRESDCYLEMHDVHLFRQTSVDAALSTMVWLNDADTNAGVLYDWPQRVAAVIQWRRQRFAPEAPVLVRVQP